MIFPTLLFILSSFGPHLLFILFIISPASCDTNQFHHSWFPPKAKADLLYKHTPPHPLFMFTKSTWDETSTVLPSGPTWRLSFCIFIILSDRPSVPPFFRSDGNCEITHQTLLVNPPLCFLHPQCSPPYLYTVKIIKITMFLWTKDIILPCPSPKATSRPLLEIFQPISVKTDLWRWFWLVGTQFQPPPRQMKDKIFLHQQIPFRGSLV